MNTNRQPHKADRFKWLACKVKVVAKSTRPLPHTHSFTSDLPICKTRKGTTTLTDAPTELDLNFVFVWFLHKIVCNILLTTTRNETHHSV